MTKWLVFLPTILVFQSTVAMTPERPDKNESTVSGSSSYSTQAVDAYFNKSVEERFGLSGSASAKENYQEDSFGKTTQERVQGRLFVDTWIALNESGCLKAHGQITTGAKYDSEWDETGIGDADARLNLNMRRLYLDMNCYSKLSVQAGAIPTFAAGDMGLKSDGWIDGVRVTLMVDQERKLRVVLTAGEVDELTTPDVLRRQFDGVNYHQLSVDGKLNSRMTFVADFTELDTNEYVRGALKFALKDLTKLIDSIGVENVVHNSEQLVRVISVEKQFKTWKMKISDVAMEDHDANPGTTKMPIDTFHGRGHSQQISFARDLGKKWVLRLRARKGSDGKRFEIRLDYKF